MQQSEIYSWIVKTLSETFEIDPARITPDARLYDDLDVDSIDAVDLMVKLKQHTGRRLAPEAFKSVRTVQDIVLAIQSELG